MRLPQKNGEARECAVFFVGAHFCFSDDVFEGGDGLVVGGSLDGEGVAVLSAVGETEGGGVADRGRGVVEEFGDQGEASDGFGADAGSAEQGLEGYMSLNGGRVAD